MLPGFFVAFLVSMFLRGDEKKRHGETEGLRRSIFREVLFNRKNQKPKGDTPLDPPKKGKRKK